MSSLQSLSRRVDYWSRRSVKFVRQRVSAPTGRAQAAFVVGCQRSGTNMIADVLDKSPEVWVYGEANRAAFDSYRIRPLSVTRQLVSASSSRRVVFKPICDSQHTDRLLEEHPGSKAVWVYRRYQDVANSAVSKWGDDTQVGHIRRAALEPESGHWFVDRLPADLQELAAGIYDETMTPSTGGALKWYIRNRIFFDLGLDRDTDRVLLVRYEDLVTDTVNTFRRLFEFLDLRFDPACCADVFDSSVGKSGFPDIDPRVEALCEELTTRLHSAARAQTGMRADSAHTPS